VPELAGLDRMSQAALRQLLELLAALHPLVDVWGPASPWSERHDGRVRPSLATAKATVVQDLERGLAQAGAAARAFAARMDAAPPGVAVEQIAAARAALEVAVASRATRTDERDPRGLWHDRPARPRPRRSGCARPARPARPSMKRALPWFGWTRPSPSTPSQA
jgi:hypothetical protein